MDDPPEQVLADYLKLSETHQTLIDAYNERMRELDARNEQIRILKAHVSGFVNESVKLGLTN